MRARPSRRDARLQLMQPLPFWLEVKVTTNGDDAANHSDGRGTNRSGGRDRHDGPTMPMPMPVTAFNLNDCPIGAAQRIGCCCGHSRCRHGWCECKTQPVNPIIRNRFILVPPPLWQVLCGLSVPFLQCWLNGAFTDRSRPLRKPLK